jgi:hypothetical protein
MPVNLTDLNNAIATLRSALSVGLGALNTPTSTSTNFSGNAATIATAVSGIQSVLTAGGLDSDLVTQQAALEAAMVAGGDALGACRGKAVAGSRFGAADERTEEIDRVGPV